MALDRTKGEEIEGLGKMYRVVPTDKWATTRFGAPMFLEAHEKATFAFKQSMGRFCRKGEKLNLSRNNVLVQEYPLLNKVAYIFEAKVNGKTMVYPYVFTLEPAMITELEQIGQWGNIILQ